MTGPDTASPRADLSSGLRDQAERSRGLLLRGPGTLV